MLFNIQINVICLQPSWQGDWTMLHLFIFFVQTKSTLIVVYSHTLLFLLYNIFIVDRAVLNSKGHRSTIYPQMSEIKLDPVRSGECSAVWRINKYMIVLFSAPISTGLIYYVYETWCTNIYKYISWWTNNRCNIKNHEVGSWPIRFFSFSQFFADLAGQAVTTNWLKIGTVYSLQQ